jgi:DNA-binding NarL/FixJ family response regulator
MDTERESARPVCVVVADDHALTRYEIRRALELHPALRVVGEAATGEEAVALTRELDPDVVVMDIRMPVLDGLAATRVIRRDCRAEVVLISSYEAALYSAAAAEIGAASYISKSASDESLVAAVLEAAMQAIGHA